MDLTRPLAAYMYGLFLTDGHIGLQSRDRGRVTIELAVRDADILTRIAQGIPYSLGLSTRTRTTNFATNHTSVTLSVCAKEFRDSLMAHGMPAGEKAGTQSPPACEFSRPDFYRGVVDGNGSVGLTATGLPFMSLCTASERLAVGYLGFVRSITGKEKKLARNTRDGVFGPSIFKEDAQAVAGKLYYDGCVAMERKMRAATTVAAWRRPAGMRGPYATRAWTEDQDRFIVARPATESVSALGRTERSIRMRLWRLRHRGGL